tara:strand:+ start:265 stop:399 length:135 start_codon:yes stop_codon:yes gene_type:complete
MVKMPKYNVPRWKHELKAYNKNRKTKVSLPKYSFMEREIDVKRT